MEHIVQIGIGIDDEEIKQGIVRQVTNQLTEELVSTAKRELGIKNYGCEYSEIVKNEVESLFNKYKDEIIDSASNKLADKLVRTKAVRNAVESVLGDTFNGD